MNNLTVWALKSSQQELLRGLSVLLYKKSGTEKNVS